MQNGDRLDTIKRCPAMHDWLSMGYLIRNRHTVLVSLCKGKDGEPCIYRFHTKRYVNRKTFIY